MACFMDLRAQDQWLAFSLCKQILTSQQAAWGACTQKEGWAWLFKHMLCPSPRTGRLPAAGSQVLEFLDPGQAFEGHCQTESSLGFYLLCSRLPFPGSVLTAPQNWQGFPSADSNQIPTLPPVTSTGTLDVPKCFSHAFTDKFLVLSCQYLIFY